MRTITPSIFTLNRLLCIALILCGGRSMAAETNATAMTEIPVAAETEASNDAWRAYLQLQEQLHAAQLAIESTRKDAELANARNADVWAGHLRDLEKRLSDQRSNEAQFMVWILSAFAGLSFLAVMITAYFQWRTVNRLADLTAALPPGRNLGPAPSVLSMPETALLQDGAVEQSGARLIGAVQRLEQRLLELERTASSTLPAGTFTTNGSADGDALAYPAPSVLKNDSVPGGEASPKEWLDRGQALLNDDQPEAALEAFEHVLQTNPNHAEALVKKGSVLEKLRRLQEALDCYDRAIAADGSMTIAYLYKGGIYNRLERFAEAVECYEKALRTQEKRSAA
jgi:tetratricopeptide (TPR) repeat protein